MCHGAYMDIKGQLSGILSYLPPRRFQKLISGHQACWQMPLFTEPLPTFQRVLVFASFLMCCFFKRLYRVIIYIVQNSLI